MRGGTWFVHAPQQALYHNTAVWRPVFGKKVAPLATNKFERGMRGGTSDRKGQAHKRERSILFCSQLSISFILYSRFIIPLLILVTLDIPFILVDGTVCSSETITLSVQP